MHYAALLLLPGKASVRFIPLFEENRLAALLDRQTGDANTAEAIYTRSGNLLDEKPHYGADLYNLIWGPLDSPLHGVKAIYFAPSGLLHRVSFSALPVNEKKVLSDKYELHQLGSTRSLVVPPPEPKAQNYTAAVFGGVQYDRNNSIVFDSTAPDIIDNRLWTYIDRRRAASDEGFKYLPGTAQEAARLTRALQAQQVTVQTFTGIQASEEMLKSLSHDTVKSPDILHIATHGFFFPDPEKRKEQHFGEENAFKWNENPLFRSGLALFGANAVWSGQNTPGNVEDGIATAYEISHLNLSNTKLVVLSACESGLGDIKGSEGVFGLQRAFKMAGTDYLLVSLWQVPDKETVEFMDLFYKSWLSGKTIHEAFAKAQKKMRKKYKEVYKWGAWVLVE
jgi:CHAT domain-containing protein